MKIFTRLVFHPVFDRIDDLRGKWKEYVYTGNALKGIYDQQSVPVKVQTAEILAAVYFKTAVNVSRCNHRS